MSALTSALVALAHPETRAAAARALGAALGGSGVLVFVRDPEVDVLLPGPGFPQTLPEARTWHRLVEACAEGGDRAGMVMPPDADADTDVDAPVPAFGFACGRDVVAVVLGTAARPAGTDEIRELLPLLAAALRGERAAATAAARAQVARMNAAEAEALARALDEVRGQLQRALAASEHAGVELEAQAVELEQQADELQRTNQALEEARHAADAANRAKSEFLATMSHELRTPLNAIGGHLQLLELGIYGPLSDGQREALTRIDRSQRHLLGLINDVLNLARIEAGRVEYQVVDVALADALADLAPMIEPQIAARALRYTVRLDEPRRTVHADRDKLEQILLNLLSNAVKFTDAGGHIVVESAPGEPVAPGAADAAGVVEVRVSDSGRGIPAAKLEQIFEPFVQVDGSHSRTGQGTGLGLAISRDLARGMGGDLRVRSTLGGGSTFVLSLPAAASG